MKLQQSDETMTHEANPTESPTQIVFKGLIRIASWQVYDNYVSV